MTIKDVYNVTQLSRAINDMLNEYSHGIGEDIGVLAEKVAKMGAKKLKMAGSFKDRRGDYRKGWRAKKIGSRWVVHNATDYRLTHLLEHGHAIAKGGRESPSFPHIKDVENEMIAEFEREVLGVIRNR